MTHLAIDFAVLAVTAARRGDTASAAVHLSSAQHQARVAARRERQVVEIAALIVAGDRQRAVGLALEHNVEYPEDAGLLSQIAPTGG